MRNVADPPVTVSSLTIVSVVPVVDYQRMPPRAASLIASAALALPALSTRDTPIVTTPPPAHPELHPTPEVNVERYLHWLVQHLHRRTRLPNPRTISPVTFTSEQTWGIAHLTNLAQILLEEPSPLTQAVNDAAGRGELAAEAQRWLVRNESRWGQAEACMQNLVHQGRSRLVIPPAVGDQGLCVVVHDEDSVPHAVHDVRRHRQAATELLQHYQQFPFGASSTERTAVRSLTHRYLRAWALAGETEALANLRAVDRMRRAHAAWAVARGAVPLTHSGGHRDSLLTFLSNQVPSVATVVSDEWFRAAEPPLPVHGLALRKWWRKSRDEFAIHGPDGWEPRSVR